MTLPQRLKNYNYLRINNNNKAPFRIKHQYFFSLSLQPNAFVSVMDLFQTLGPRPHLWFPNRQFFTGWGCQPEGSGPIFINPGTVWPSYTPRYWVPILLTFYDMHRLQWDYYLILVTTRDIIIITIIK